MRTPKLPTQQELAGLTEIVLQDLFTQYPKVSEAERSEAKKIVDEAYIAVFDGYFPCKKFAELPNLKHNRLLSVVWDNPHECETTCIDVFTLLSGAMIAHKRWENKTGLDLPRKWRKKRL